MRRRWVVLLGHRRRWETHAGAGVGPPPAARALTARHHARDCLAVSLHALLAPLATSTISLDAPEINTVALYKLITPHNPQGERENIAR